MTILLCSVFETKLDLRAKVCVLMMMMICDRLRRDTGGILFEIHLCAIRQREREREDSEGYTHHSIASRQTLGGGVSHVSYGTGPTW